MMDESTPTPDSETDEILSASIDGELRPTEHAPADDAAARRAELVGARDALHDAPVAPLDEVTRRRLVSRALGDSAASTRGGWTERVPWRAVAAVLAVVVIVGGVALSLQRGGESSSSTASRAKSATGTTAQPKTAAAPDLSAARALGDLGDVSDPTRLAPLVRMADQLATARDAGGTQSSIAAPATPAGALGACASALHGLGTIRAIGSGTVDGRAAAVAVVTDRQGHEQAVVVLLDGCKARPPVSL